MKVLRSKYCLIILLSQVFIIPAFGITAKFSFTKLSNCAPTIVKFTNNSTRGPGITYTWDFDLGAIVSATDYLAKEQLYTKAGQYTVTLKVTNGINTDSTSAVITISRGPIANFTADPVNGCPPMLVNFTSISTPGESDIINTLWDFRNGDHKEGPSVQYNYDRPGMYDVILKVTDKNGCYSVLESEKSITVTDKPKIDFTASDTFACAPPMKVSFTNLSTGSSDLTYNWDFGNGSTSTNLSSSSVYDSNGVYSVKLKATDQFGCSDSLIKKSYITIGYKGTLSVYDAHNNIVNTSYICDGTYRFVFSVATLPDYTWSITDNNITSTFRGKNSITYQVKGSGKISVKLVYGKNSFCTDSTTLSFTKSYIKAAFSLADTLFCSVPSLVNLINSSQNANIFAWYLSDKLISDESVTSYTVTQKDLPEETYQQLYNHEIKIIKLPFKLVASNGGVCYDSVTNMINVALPVARFMPDKVSGCIPLQVSLSDSSKSLFRIDAYTYKIGNDSVTSFDESPVNYTFNKPGEYYVSEIIRSGSCSDTSEVVRIVAGDKLIPDFTVTPDEVCNGGTIHLTGEAGNNSLVDMWRFRAANLFNLNFTSRPDTTFTIDSDSSGYKDISLQVDYNGCLSETTKKNILKIKGPIGNFSESFSCDSSLIYHFKSAISPVTSLSWNIDTTIINNVDSLKYVFPSGDDFTVKLVATDNSSNCTLTRTKLIKVRQVMADFTLNDTVFCAGDTVSMNSSISRDFINTCYNEGFLWNFGDDSPPGRTFLTKYDHIYSSKGAFTIGLVVTADDGCTDTVKKVVHVFRPAGSFTTDKKSGCLPELSVNFINTSKDTTIVGWIWNFGDNLSDSTNSINVTHLYSSFKQQTYYPTLTVYDAYQCSSNYAIPTQLIGINSNFQADDNATCIGQAVTFTPVDASLTNLYWDFGDGSVPGNINTHTYLKPGQFNVSLTASKEGCSGTLTKSNYINVETADANFTVSDSIFYCYPDTVNFIHNISIGSPVVDYQWTFDSNILTDRSSNNVKYAFTRPGNHPAQLTVRTLNGCTASKSRHIAITGPSAVVSFAPREICYNDVVSFRIDSLKNVSQWKWFFGDGNTSTDNPVSHRYTSRGKIIPAVQLIDGNCKAINVLDTLSVSRVKAEFDSSDSSLYICFGNKLNLLNSSANSNSWSWNINNVQTSTGYNLNNILFSKTGDYYVRLVARETSGCTDTLIKKFTVIPNPVFSISGDSILCAGMNSVILSVNNNSGKAIKWTPSSGLSNTSAFTTTAKPTVSTTYTAQVTDVYGCTGSRKKTIMVNQPFDLSRSPLSDTSIYLGEKVQLIVLTTAGNVSYSWSPNNNISCLNCNDPWVAPTKSVTYTVETKNDCFDFTENFNVEVIRDFYLEAPSAFTPNGDSNNDLFKFEEKNVKNFDLKIFNRWGEIVFSTNDVNQGWDGNVNGHAQNIDTYVYSVKAETIHGYKFEKKGEFLLLK